MNLATLLPVDSFNVVALIATMLLAALGLHFSLGLVGVVNMVHGEFMLVGAYTAYQVQTVWGSPTWGFVLAPVIAAALGGVAEVVLIRRLYRRPLDTLLVTFGLSLLIRQGVQLYFSPNPKRVRDPIGGAAHVFGYNVPWWRLAITIAAVVVVLAWALVDRTSVGVRWKAAVVNPELAESMGYSVRRARTSLFVIGCGVMAAARGNARVITSSALLAPLNSLSPQYGLRFLVNSFLVVILGRPGSLKGLVIAAAVLGGSLGIMQFHISTVYAQMLMLLIAVVAARLRPMVMACAGASRGH
jgi:branched-chain amino acid transport system permease protein/urea transport system permease protein